MKKWMIVAVTGFLPMVAHAQLKPFTLEGKFVSDTAVTGVVLLSYEDEGQAVRDTCFIKNNTYHFAGKLKSVAVTGNLFFSENFAPRTLKGFAQFYISGGKITATHMQQFSKYELKGAQDQSDADALKKALAASKTDSDMDITKDFIRQYPESWVSYVKLEELVRLRAISFDTAAVLYKKLGSRLTNAGQVQELGSKIAGRGKAAVGKVAMDFTQNDVNGKPVKLSDYRGKYVFLDFWASWCHPCRDEIPKILVAYNAFKQKNFDVLGVSLDAGKLGREAWLKAIKDDGAVWTQVCDLKGAKNDAAVLYGVITVPSNFLIDPEGKIIAKDIGGEELQKILGEILH